jgi:pimeloyl-ACP methyl ester carboxylesterase
MLKHGAIGVVVGAIIGLAIGGIGIGALIGAIASVGIHSWTSRRSVALLLLLAVGAVDSAAAQSSPQDESDLPIFFEVRGEGPAVLLVHGGMMDRRMWDPQWEGLGDDVRLIRFDVRGAGQSPRSEAFHPAEDMLAILDELGVDKAYIVGLSNGGAFAVDFALMYPDRVTKLIVAEPGLTGFQFDASVMQQQLDMITAFRARDTEEATRVALSSPAFEHTREHPAAWDLVRRLVQENISSFAMFPLYRYHEPRAVDALGRLSIPVALIVSEYSGPSALAIADLLERDVPDLVRFTIADAGHMMNLENPQAFNQILKEIVVE